LRAARAWVAIIRRELAETRAQLKPRLGIPSSWIVGALCVHSGWHYTTTRQHGRPEYVIDGVGYWRTWDVPNSIAGGSGEGGWDASNGRYGGGMQMDRQFQSNYGPEYVASIGPAGRWPVAVQLLVAHRGWLRQGWGAWPNTSRACGLR
jgi:hypothetical protein